VALCESTDITRHSSRPIWELNFPIVVTNTTAQSLTPFSRCLNAIHISETEISPVVNTLVQAVNRPGLAVTPLVPLLTHIPKSGNEENIFKTPACLSPAEICRDPPRPADTRRYPPEPAETRRDPPEPAGTRRNPPEPAGTHRNQPKPAGTRGNPPKHADSHRNLFAFLQNYRIMLVATMLSAMCRNPEFPIL
jgi:hypothetical protein